MRGPFNDGNIYDQTYGRVTIFEPTPEQHDELSMLVVDGREFATNVALWDRLQAEHVQRLMSERAEQAEAEERAAAQSGDDDAAPAEDFTEPETSGDDDGPAIDRETENPLPAPTGCEKSATDALELAWGIYRWKIAQLRWLIPAYLKRAGMSDLLRIFVLLHCCYERFDDGSQVLDECLGELGLRKRTDDYANMVLARLAECNVDGLVAEVLGRHFYTDREGPVADVPEEAVEMIASLLAIELPQDWARGDILAGPAYFDLHTPDQLQAIAKEVHADLGGCKRKADMVAKLVAALPSRDEIGNICEGIPIPREIVKAKRPKV
jgi:hypothetical protein